MKILLAILFVCIGRVSKLNRPLSFNFKLSEESFECFSGLVQLDSNCLNRFNYGMLQVHNFLRMFHSASPLKLHTTIIEMAQNYADYLGYYNIFEHSQTDGYGENLAATWLVNQTDLSDCSTIAATFAQMWYDEVKNYDYNTPGFSMNTGHFTQFVWQSTTHLGCGLSLDTNNKLVGVCNYYPPGNYEGNYQKNVLPNSKSYYKQFLALFI